MIIHKYTQEEWRQSVLMKMKVKVNEPWPAESPDLNIIESL